MKDYAFSDYKTFKELFRDLYYRTVTIDEAESKRDEFNVVLHVLKKYSPKHDKYVTLKNNLVDNASKFYKGREKIIEGFKNGVFPFYYDREHEKRMKYEEEKEQEEKQKPTKDDLIALNKHIIDEETNINEEVFKKYFHFLRPSDILMYLNKTNDKEKNNELVSLIISRLKELKQEIKKMPKEIEEPESIIEIVEDVLKFNEQKQKGQGIKMPTPNQMLNRLPISLAQLQAGNNSKKNLKMK